MGTQRTHSLPIPTLLIDQRLPVQGYFFQDDCFGFLRLQIQFNNYYFSNPNINRVNNVPHNSSEGILT